MWHQSMAPLPDLPSALSTCEAGDSRHDELALVGTRECSQAVVWLANFFESIS